MEVRQMKCKQWELRQKDIQEIIMRDQKNSFLSSADSKKGHPIFSPKQNVLGCTGPSPSISQHHEEKGVNIYSSRPRLDSPFSSPIQHEEAKTERFFQHYSHGSQVPASSPSLILQSLGVDVIS